MARSALIYVLSVVIVFGLLAIAIVIGSVVGTLTSSIWGVAAAAISFGGMAFGGGWLFLIFAVLRRKSLLDKAFEPLGLEGKAYRLMFRRYQGVVNGRNVEVFFYRGPILDVLINSSLKTRAGITLDYADTRVAANLFGMTAVEHNVPSMEEVKIWSEDQIWSRNLVSEPSIGRHIRVMLAEKAFFVRNNVKVFPGYAQLQLSGNTNLFRWSISPEQAGEWVMSLVAFAEMAEKKIPPPSRPIEMSSSEEFALQVKRKDTTKFTIYFVAGLLTFFALVTVAVAVFVAVLANFS